MAHTTASVGKPTTPINRNSITKNEIYNSITTLFNWIEKNNYSGYDTFDGLNAKYIRPFTFNNMYLRIVLQQGVRRFLFNIRPLLGISQSPSSKAMGFFAKAFLRLYEATCDEIWRQKAEIVLQWLIDNQCQGYSGACWGNHFDYQSRSGFVTKNTPSIVWTSLIAHAFLDAYRLMEKKQYLDIAVSSCKHIINDMTPSHNKKSICLHYFPGSDPRIHNANTLGASLLARVFMYSKDQTMHTIAKKAFHYTANHQNFDSSWFYGEKPNLKWVDNFHTGYVLDSFKYYSDSTGDEIFEGNLISGFNYWKNTFFLTDGTPRYYNYKTLPIDIQCCSQSIDTLTFFGKRDPESLQLALKIAQWTINKMQDRTGYFYYRRYNCWIVNKTPTLHWGQSTMLCALSGLYLSL